MGIHKQIFDWVNMTDKEIKTVYKKRRKNLETCHCPRCGEVLREVKMNCKYLPELKGKLLLKGGIMKDNKCPNCETDLMEFCFQDMIDVAKEKARVIVEKGKEKVKSLTSKKKSVTKKKTKKSDNKQPQVFIQESLF